ncbi:hypothetical protein V7x_52200 [Crateriforma conspicua]|uniref:Uncharacterized protein n=1 Tax=Crateriforma conspicua TaxID=2527996 RepID=A0A5C6FLL1_9PLAN|nr:hypothetical protein V7x_52200 [Crateriforma conspicua]
MPEKQRSPMGHEYSESLAYQLKAKAHCRERISSALASAIHYGIYLDIETDVHASVGRYIVLIADRNLHDDLSSVTRDTIEFSLDNRRFHWCKFGERSR